MPVSLARPTNELYPHATGQLHIGSALHVLTLLPGLMNAAVVVLFCPAPGRTCKTRQAHCNTHTHTQSNSSYHTMQGQHSCSAASVTAARLSTSFSNSRHASACVPCPQCTHNAHIAQLVLKSAWLAGISLDSLARRATQHRGNKD
jgi:hypothetical protein